MTTLELARQIRSLLYSESKMGRLHRIKLLVEQLVTMLEEESKGETK